MIIIVLINRKLQTNHVMYHTTDPISRHFKFFVIPVKTVGYAEAHGDVHRVLASSAIHYFQWQFHVVDDREITSVSK